MARPPIPGPPPGAATGTRPGVGVTADGRHLSAKLGVVISELQKVNGRSSGEGLRGVKKEIQSINSNISNLINSITANNRAAFRAGAAASRGSQQNPTQGGSGGGGGGGNQGNQNQQNQNQNQNQTQTGGIFGFLKNNPVAAAGGGFAAGLGLGFIGSFLKFFLNPKTVRGRAAIGVIGLAMADQVVDFLLGKEGESAVRDVVDENFNVEAALGLGFLASAINFRLGLFTGFAALFATDANLKKFDNLMSSVKKRGESVRDHIEEKLLPYFDEFFNVQLPTVDQALGNISEGMGKALESLTMIVDGDFKDAFTNERGNRLAFFTLLGTRMAGITGLLKRSPNMRAKLAGYVMDGLMIGLGFDMLLDQPANPGGGDPGPVNDEMNNIDNSGVDMTVPIVAAGGTMLAKSTFDRFAARTGSAAASNTARVAAGATLGSRIMSGAYNMLQYGKNLYNRAGVNRFGNLSRSQMLSKAAALKSALIAKGYRFDVKGFLIGPNGKPATNKYIINALNSVGRKQLANVFIRISGVALLCLAGSVVGAAAVGAVTISIISFTLTAATVVSTAYLGYEILKKFAPDFADEYITEPAKDILDYATRMYKSLTETLSSIFAGITGNDVPISDRLSSIGMYNEETGTTKIMEGTDLMNQYLNSGSNLSSVFNARAQNLVSGGGPDFGPGGGPSFFSIDRSNNDNSVSTQQFMIKPNSGHNGVNPVPGNDVNAIVFGATP